MDILQNILDNTPAKPSPIAPSKTPNTNAMDAIVSSTGAKTAGTLPSTTVNAPSPPPAGFSTQLPDAVMQSFDNAQQVKQDANKAQMQRNSDFINLLSSEQSNINKAEDNIATISQNPFSEIIGYFNPDYNLKTQQANIVKSQNIVKNQMQINNLKSANDQLAVENAATDYNSYVNKLGMQGKIMALNADQIKMFETQRAAFMHYQQLFLDQLPYATVQDIYNTKSFNNVATESAVTAYMQRHETAVMNLQSLKLANDKAAMDNTKENIDLKNKLQAEALKGLSIGYLQQQLDLSANSKNPGMVDLGQGVSMPRDVIVNAINNKQKANDQLAADSARTASDLAKNDAGFNNEMFNAGTLSMSYSNSVMPLQFQNMNLKNVTTDQVSKIDWSGVRPDLKIPMQELLMHTANMNEQKTPPTKAQVLEQYALIKQLHDANEKAKKAEIASQPTAALKSVAEEWFNKGKIQSPVNAAEMTADNISSMPNMMGDPGLEAAYQQTALNVIDFLGGNKVDLTDKSIDPMTKIQAMIASTTKGKQIPRDIISQTIRKIDPKNNMTPLKIYASKNAMMLMQNAVKELVQKTPGLQAVLYNADGTPKQNWNINFTNLNGILATEAFKAQQADPKLPNNYLNAQLAQLVHEQLQKMKPIFNAQMNMQRGAFMVNLFQQSLPSDAVQGFLNAQYFSQSNGIWDQAVKGTPTTAQYQQDQNQSMNMYEFQRIGNLAP